MAKQRNKKRSEFLGHVKQRGSVLFYAITLSAIALMLGGSILNIIQRELSLSFLSRESQRALYAADTGLECALMWEFDQVTIKQGGRPSPPLGVSSYGWFASSSASANESTTGLIGREFCLGQEVNGFTAQGVPAYNDQLTNGPVTGGPVIPTNADWYFADDAWPGVSVAADAATTTFRLIAQSGRYGQTLSADMPCVEVRVAKWMRNVWIPAIATFRNVPMTRIYSEGFSTCAPNAKNRVSRLIVADF
jgi:hypothetical protein